VEFLSIKAQNRGLHPARAFSFAFVFYYIRFFSLVLFEEVRLGHVDCLHLFTESIAFIETKLPCDHRPSCIRIFRESRRWNACTGTLWVFALKERNVAVGWILVSSVVISRLLMGWGLFRIDSSLLT
jgi:hypothetical protein